MQRTAPLHLSRAELEAGLAARPAPPTDRGRVVLLVRRLPEGGRETPTDVSLSVDGGLPGDDWTRRPPRDPDAQLSVMRADLAQIVAGTQALSVFGDNLFVDLDLSAANMVPGTRLALGAAVVEVTPKPHDGCKKFRERFGLEALAFVQAPATRAQNRRGVYWRVVEPGIVGVGAPIRVVSRP